MKKIILIIFSIIFVLTIFPVVEAKNFNDLTSYQKQKYWVYIKECSPLLLNKEYNKYRICALAAFEKASQEKETNAWCTDSDGGKDFLIKGIVKTDIYPEGKEDYVKTFSNGTTYLMEGFCSSKNQYAFAQKKCSDFGKKYYAKDGACIYENQSPVLTIAVNTTEINEGDYYEIYLYGSDADNDNLTFSAENLPEGAKINEVAPVPFPYDKKVAIFSWTPTFAQAGTYQITFKVSDGGENDSMIVEIIVANVCNTWDKTFGGSDYDMAYSINQTTDGGYIVAGDTYSKGAGLSDVWVLKLDSMGALEWDKVFGGSDYDEARSVQQTIDGGYIVAGWTKSKGAGNYDGWILKLDPNGELEWDKTFGGNDEDSVYSIQQTTDGGYITAGLTFSGDIEESDAWILKLDSDGNLEWDKIFGGSNYDYVYSIQQTIDGGYIVAGDTKSKGAGNGDAWILKLNSSGDLVWDKTFNKFGSDATWSIQQTTDKGYIVGGTTGPDYHVWILKLNSNGELEWDKIFGGGQAWSVQQTKDGGYIVVGYKPSFGFTDALVFKVDSSGNLECE